MTPPMVLEFLTRGTSPTHTGVCGVLTGTTAPRRKLFWVLGAGLWSEGRLTASLGVGGVGSLRLRPLFVPSTAVPAAQIFLDQSIYRPLAPQLPLSPRR